MEEKITLEQASQIYYINLEIKRIRLDLAKLRDSRVYYKANIMTDMPKGGGSYINPEDEYLAREMELEGLLNHALKKLQQERLRMERFLNSVQDAEMRLILRLRCINNMTWKDIGAEIGADRTTVSKKFYAFFESFPQFPSDL